MDPENQKPLNQRKIEDTDCVDQSTDSSSVGSSSSVGETYAIGSSDNFRESPRNDGSINELGLSQRLSNILVDEGDGDLLLQRSDREDRVIRWLQALDMHVMGACRADERLKPLLKLNVSGGVAEDRLLSHLSQHFEPSEVGILARCLCIPLVSIRVGKINKHGTLLCPTGTRGNLTLTLLPTSDLRVAFIGDDGRVERLSTVNKSLHCSIAIEGIPADCSGRSFLIKLPDGETYYFWCSEKSKLLGDELLEKLKDLLKRKPSLAELSGISESRLGCFATYIRGYLVAPAGSNTQTTTVVTNPELCQNAQVTSSSSKPSSRPRIHNSSHGVKPNPFYQGSLSPRSRSSFKEGLPRNLSSLRSISKEKFRRRAEILVSCPDNISSSSSSSSAAALPSTPAFISNQSRISKLPESLESCLFPPSSFLESLGTSTIPPFFTTTPQVPSLSSSLISPYYCWCPPVASSLQYTIAPPRQPKLSTESFSLPPLSSALLASNPLNLPDLPSLDFPSFLPDPLMRLPLSMTTSQQIPTFTPLMCDSIVHLPVIDICSSGQGYLVSAGPSMSTGITPLHPPLGNPLIPETDSMVEKSARETLRLLLGSSGQSSPQLMSVLPSVLTSCEEAHCLLAAGSRGLYSGVRDVGSIANSISAVGMVSLSVESSGTRRCVSQVEFIDQFEKPVGSSGGTCSENGGPFVSKSGNGEGID